MEDPPNHQTLKRGGHNNDLGRRIPWWRGRQEGAGHHHCCWSQFLAGFIHPVWWHPPDDGRQCIVVPEAGQLRFYKLQVSTSMEVSSSGRQPVCPKEVLKHSKAGLEDVGGEEKK